MTFSKAVSRVFRLRRPLPAVSAPAPVSGDDGARPWVTGYGQRAPEVDWNRVHDMHLAATGNDPKEKLPGGSNQRTQGVFHPSSGLHHKTGNCPRQVILDLMHATRSPTKILTNVQRAMNHGSDRHKGLQRVFLQMAERGTAGVAYAWEDVHLSHPSHAISGSADLIVQMRSGAVYLLDIKTVSPAQFKNLFKPKWEQILQVNTYMGMAGIEAGYVLSEDRATLEFAKPLSKFRVDFSPQLWAETLEYCRDMLLMLKSGHLPEYDEAVCKSSLMFCDYEAGCVAHRKGLASFSALDHRPDSVRKHHLKVVQ